MLLFSHWVGAILRQCFIFLLMWNQCSCYLPIVVITGIITMQYANAIKCFPLISLTNGYFKCVYYCDITIPLNCIFILNTKIRKHHYSILQRKGLLHCLNDLNVRTTEDPNISTFGIHWNRLRVEKSVSSALLPLPGWIWSFVWIEMHTKPKDLSHLCLLYQHMKG